MITVISGNHRYPLVPTIFPDGTSQIWKLPEDVLRSSGVTVDWRFESEREVIDLLSLSKLIDVKSSYLLVPYLPYARQDKEVSNTSTFNLEIIANLINSMKFQYVAAFDVHNPDRTKQLIRNFININPNDFHVEAIGESKPDFLVFPDKGAWARYCLNRDYEHVPTIVCDKVRDQLTGEIKGHKIVQTVVPKFSPAPSTNRFLIVDDLCDGGATFISVAKMLKGGYSEDAVIDLCVSHGLFSKGREALLNNGINKLYTTNSLSKNEDGYSV